MKFLIFLINFALFSFCAAINIKIENSDSLDTTKPPEPSESEFIKIGNRFYFIEDKNKVNWFEAANICRTKGTYLATFKTQEDASAITAYLEAKDYGGYLWIGGNDLAREDEFHWIDTGLLLSYTNWGMGQPDNDISDEHCMQIWNRENKYLWNDNNCHNIYGYICEAIIPETFALTLW